jgi:hypothetical protein
MKSIERLFLLVLLLVHTTPLIAQNSEEPITKSSPFTQMTGTWIGEGKYLTDGSEFMDSLKLTPAVNDNFLRFVMTEIGGAGLIIEGYLNYNPETNEYSFFEFNNGSWPLRKFVGEFSENQFRLVEKTEGRHILLEWNLISDSQMLIRESHIKPEGNELFMEEKFIRVMGK